MKKYLVDFHFLATADTAAIRASMPAEQAEVARLHAAGTLEAVYVAENMQRGWLVFKASDLEELNRLLEGLPLRPFWQLAITPLHAL